MVGASASIAGSASEGMERLIANVPDVLVCDLGMPGEDGYSLIKRVRALDAPEMKSLPAVALSAYARAEDRATAIRAGFQDHLAKPVELAKLLRVVKLLVDQTRAAMSKPELKD